jgi:glyoxylase I family protein
MTRVHHTAICTGDVERSLRFWRDGLGFEVQMDLAFEGGWRELFDAPSDRLRSVFLGAPVGEPGADRAGIVELVDLCPDGGALPEGPTAAAPTTGFFLVSVYVGSADALDAALARLRALRFDVEPRRVEVHGVAMAVVRDPNGVRVELIGLPG